MQLSFRCVAIVLGVFSLPLKLPATTVKTNSISTGGACRQVVVEGSVAAGEGFERVFAKGFRFYLEPLRSGWIVRVLDSDAPRGTHDFAELASPPYQSVSPLLISTDWAFRAQDAVAWNPRHFRFAADRNTFHLLERLQPAALTGDAESETKLARLVSVQPEGTIELLDSRFAPGMADQAKMASAVAVHLSTTPHVADNSASPTKLGKLEFIRFRVTLQLPTGALPVKEVPVLRIPCHPTN